MVRPNLRFRNTLNLITGCGLTVSHLLWEQGIMQVRFLSSGPVTPCPYVLAVLDATLIRWRSWFNSKCGYAITNNQPIRRNLMSAESNTLFFAKNADEAVDAMLVEANQDGRPMFLLEEGDRGFISGELLIYVYA